MTTVFADTFYYLALINPDDLGHRAAVEFTRTFKGRIVTTDGVLIEVADALSSPPGRVHCAAFLLRLLRHPSVTVIPATRDLVLAGLDLYARRPDKAWSLTDCLSFVVMEREQITDALSGDHHFAQAGFNPLLKL